MKDLDGAGHVSSHHIMIINPRRWIRELPIIVITNKVKANLPMSLTKYSATKYPVFN
jgi:hypothetical protein